MEDQRARLGRQSVRCDDGLRIPLGRAEGGQCPVIIASRPLEHSASDVKHHRVWRIGKPGATHSLGALEPVLSLLESSLPDQGVAQRHICDEDNRRFAPAMPLGQLDRPSASLYGERK